jgi:hypothetical protein
MLELAGKIQSEEPEKARGIDLDFSPIKAINFPL